MSKYKLIYCFSRFHYSYRKKSRKIVITQNFDIGYKHQTVKISNMSMKFLKSTKLIRNYYHFFIEYGNIIRSLGL